MGVTHDHLIRRIADGDREAFAQLYRLCRPDVYRFAFHMCGSPATAEDVVQDVFLAVIQDAARYRADRSGVVPWLFGIARNHVRRWKYRRRMLPLPADETGDGRRLAVASDPADAIGRRQDATALARALAALPARDREVIVLCDLEELSYQTAAGVLGCAVGTVRSRLHRGRVRLARTMAGLQRGGVARLPAIRVL